MASLPTRNIEQHKNYKYNLERNQKSIGHVHGQKFIANIKFFIYTTPFTFTNFEF